MYEPYTIKDIAKALGLSTSTVSRALRGSYEISQETKKVVLEYAEKINYRPNPIALSLKERRSRAIGIVVCEIANNFFSQIINGIESIAYNRGYNVIITQSHESYEREVVNVQHLASRSVDGLLVSLSSETIDIAHFKHLHDRGLPIVFFDRIPKEISTHKVRANNFKGAFDATEHLILNGFKKIAHLTTAAHLSTTLERLEGYQAALQKYDIPFRSEFVENCHQGGKISDDIEQAVYRQINLKDPATAFFTAGDRLTIGCMKALKKFNISVPSQIAIAGFTNSDATDLLNPSLTCVRQPAFEMGQIATEMLIQILESRYPIEDFETKTLDTELLVRDSTKAS